MTPNTVTIAVANARRTPTVPSNWACSRATSTPAPIRCSLRERTRSDSMSSAPNAFTTAIADSASLATDARSPSWRRCLRARSRTRRRKIQLITTRIGAVLSDSSASTGSMNSSTAVMPIASSADCSISLSVSENSWPMSRTSLITRVSRSPFWLRWWNARLSRCRWS